VVFHPKAAAEGFQHFGYLRDQILFNGSSKHTHSGIGDEGLGEPIPTKLNTTSFN
jgi:hypothetical protein